MKDKFNFTKDKDKSFPFYDLNDSISHVKTIDVAIHYHSLEFSIIPIPKPNEIIGQKWDNKEQINKLFAAFEDKEKNYFDKRNRSKDENLLNEYSINNNLSKEEAGSATSDDEHISLEKNLLVRSLKGASPTVQIVKRFKEYAKFEKSLEPD